MDSSKDPHVPYSPEYWESPDFTNQVKSLTPNNRQPVPLEVLIKLRTENHLSYNQIAKLVGYSKRWVIFKLSGIDTDGAKTYIDNRPIYFQSMQFKLLNSITDQKLKDLSPRDAVVAAGILYDKERLETGQSTSNQAVRVQGQVSVSVVPGVNKARRLVGKSQVSPTQIIQDNLTSDNDNLSDISDNE